MPWWKIMGVSNHCHQPAGMAYSIGRSMRKAWYMVRQKKKWLITFSCKRNHTQNAGKVAHLVNTDRATASDHTVVQLKLFLKLLCPTVFLYMLLFPSPGPHFVWTSLLAISLLLAVYLKRRDVWFYIYIGHLLVSGSHWAGLFGTCYHEGTLVYILWAFTVGYGGCSEVH